jgi:hypothetical protein
MRRALVGTAFTAIALLAIAQPANAAPRPAPAGLGSATTTTDKNASATWVSDPTSTAAGFTQRIWQVQFDVFSSLPDAIVLNVSSCVDYYDSNMTFKKETCTAGAIPSGFTSTVDAANLTHASVSASGIPAQTCSTDANFQPIGQCKPAAPMSVKATWTGQGPITYSKYIEYVPGVYRLVIRSKSRGADASATFNRKSPTGQLAFADISYQITKEWGSPCGTGSPQRGLTHLINVHPDGC